MKLQKRLRIEGFTIVEIMIVVSILCFLALLAIPAFKRAKLKTVRTQLISELRTTGESFQIYASDHGSNMPDTAMYGEYPDGMQTYLPKNSTWTGVPPGGGHWAWLSFKDGSSVGGFKGFVAVIDSDFSTEDIQMIDEEIDNGVLSKGGLIYSKPWVLYGVN